MDQTCLQAQRFGIAVTNANEVEDLSTDFLDGREIYVCTIQKLFNGLTKFRLKGSSLSLGTLLIDDSHACIDSIRQACSIVLKAGATPYGELLQLFTPDLREQGTGTLASIVDGDYDALLPVPYWAWIDRRDEVTEILAKHRHGDDLRFVWPILKDSGRNPLHPQGEATLEAGEVGKVRLELGLEHQHMGRFSPHVG